MITENSTKKTQARAFSYFAFAGNVGIFFGSFIGMPSGIRAFNSQLTYALGGALESPAKKFPAVFGRVQFFHDYPYAFPGFVVSSIALTAALLATFVIKEVSSIWA